MKRTAQSPYRWRGLRGHGHGTGEGEIKRTLLHKPFSALPDHWDMTTPRLKLEAARLGSDWILGAKIGSRYLGSLPLQVRQRGVNITVDSPPQPPLPCSQPPAALVALLPCTPDTGRGPEPISPCLNNYPQPGLRSREGTSGAASLELAARSPVAQHGPAVQGYKRPSRLRLLHFHLALLP